MQTFYNYVYVDPRKPGKFSYEHLNVCFLFEPYYVGKGTNNRKYEHLKERKGDKNVYKKRKIQNIKQVCENPQSYIITLNDNVSESVAFIEETYLIKKIGRKDLSLGPLVNMNDGGTGGNHNLGKKLPSYESKLKGKTYEEIYGAEKARTLKKDRSQKLSKVAKERTREQNPFFGKNHSEESRKKIGEKSKGRKANSKKWTLISPEGNEYHIVGEFKKFCIEHNLSGGMLKRFINKGPVSIDNYSPSNKSKYMKNELICNSIGWQLIISGTPLGVVPNVKSHPA